MAVIAAVTRSVMDGAEIPVMWYERGQRQTRMAVPSAVMPVAEQVMADGQ
jgi:hypothetical protein